VTIATGYSGGGSYYLGPAIASDGNTAFVVHSQELSSVLKLTWLVMWSMLISVSVR